MVVLSRYFANTIFHRHCNLKSFNQKLYSIIDRLCIPLISFRNSRTRELLIIKQFQEEEVVRLATFTMIILCGKYNLWAVSVTGVEAVFVVAGHGGATLGVGLKWESKANEQIASYILWVEGMYFYRYQ